MAPALAEAYQALAYDIGYNVREDADWLRAHDMKAPQPFKTASKQVQVSIFNKADKKIGVLMLPTLLKGTKKPTSMMLRTVVQKSKQLAKRTDLVVAVSPWGMEGEFELLKNHIPEIDVLLGGGPGPGIAGRFMNNSKTFWARAYSKGKALHLIRLGEWPKRTDSWKWSKGKNLNLDFKTLTTDVAENAQMKEILAKYKLPEPK